MRIRQARSSDAPQLVDLKRSVEDEVYSELGTEAEHATGLAEFTGTDYIRDLLVTSDVCVAVLDGRDEQAVGMAALGPPLDGRSAPILHAVYIRPRHRRSGLGRRLIACTLRTSDRLDASENVEAEAYSSNEGAQGWLRSLGFEPVGESRPSVTYSAERLDLFSISVPRLREAIGERLK